jgi:hypothetical protein
MPGGAGTPGGYQPSQSYSRSYNPGAGGVVTHQPITKKTSISYNPPPRRDRGGPPSILNRPPTIPKGRTTPGGITGSNKWKKFIGPAKDYFRSLDPATFGRQVASGFGAQPRYIPWGLDKYTQGSKPGMAKIYAGASKIPQEFSKFHGRLSNLDDILKGLTGKMNLGQSEGVHTSTLKNIAKGYASDPSDPLRGTRWAKKTGDLLSGEIPTKFLNQTRNMFGQLQNIIPSELANKALLGIKNIDYSKIKNIAKPISKFMGRTIPGVGAGIGVADAAYRASKGDVLGSILSGGSAVPGWGLIPLAAQLGTDYLGLTGPKTYKAQGGIVDLYRHGGF